MVKIYDYRQKEQLYQPKSDPEPKLEQAEAREISRPRRRFAGPEEAKAYRVGVGVSTGTVLVLFGVVFLGTHFFNSSKSASAPQVQGAATANVSQPAASNNSATQAAPAQPTSATTTTVSTQTYTVQSGDTLFSIGTKLNVDWRVIADANNLQSPYSLTTDQQLKIPITSNIVKSSD